MRVYEHKVIKQGFSTLEEIVTKHEKEGWEVCGLTGQEKGSWFVVVLKRFKPELKPQHS
jgi:hypothetical protein